METEGYQKKMSLPGFDFTLPYLSRRWAYSPFFRGTTGIFRFLVPDMPVLTSIFE